MHEAGSTIETTARALLTAIHLPADLQRHLRDVHVEKVLRQRTCPKCHIGSSSSFTGTDGCETDRRTLADCQRSVGGSTGAPPEGMAVEMEQLQVGRLCQNNPL